MQPVFLLFVKNFAFPSGSLGMSKRILYGETAMRILIPSLFGILVLFGGVPSAMAGGNAVIPAQFRATWVVPWDCKEFKKTQSCPREENYSLEVTAKEVIGYEWGCHLVKATQATATRFSGEFKCGDEDGNSKESLTLSLRGGKLSHNTLHDLIRCQ
jgi:hypothetical protein